MSSELDPARDEALVRAWLEDYLCAHCLRWAEAVALGWTMEQARAHVRGHQLVARDWQELCAAQGRADALLLVQRADDGQLQGLIYGELAQDRYMLARYGVISWIYVSPAARGLKVADALMTRLMGWFSDRDVQGVEVFASEFNHAALALYARFGLKVRDVRMLGGP